MYTSLVLRAYAFSTLYYSVTLKFDIAVLVLAENYAIAVGLTRLVQRDYVSSPNFEICQHCRDKAIGHNFEPCHHCTGYAFIPGFEILHRRRICFFS